MPDIESEIIAVFDEILWVGIDLRGTRATVKVVEKEEEPKKN